jgi:proline iminopeptidase
MRSKVLHVAAFCGLLLSSGCSKRAHETPTPHDIRLEDGTLHYETMGKAGGVPLLAINGGPGFDHTVMLQSTAWESLAGKRQIVFYDQRGTGKSGSTQPLQQITVKKLVSDIEQLREHIGAAKMDLVGWSWGAYLAMAYTAAHPERVAHMVTVDGPPPNVNKNTYLFDAVYPEVTAKIPENTPGCDARYIPAYVSALFYDPATRAAFLKASKHMFYSEDMCAAAFNDAQKLDLTPAARRFPMPILITNGRYDTNVAPKVAYDLLHTFPNARLVIFEQSGHMPFVEQPKEWAAKVESFLSGGQK